MLLSAGPLDRRIVVQRATVAANDLNEDVPTWVTVCERWASKQDVSDGERFRSAQTGRTITTRFRVRDDEVTRTILETDQIQFDGRAYDIVAIKEIGRRDGWEITAAAQAERAP